MHTNELATSDARSFRYHPAYETARDKQRASRNSEPLPDNARLHDLNVRLANGARILVAAK